MTEVLNVKAPGLLTTVQDLGRPHAVASGVPSGGAMDRFAHIAANFIVGNDRNTPTLECTLRGPRLIAVRDSILAITGADFDPRVNGAPAPMWTAIALAEGDELSFGGRRIGARTYIAIAGGVTGDRWLGSLSTNLMTQRGGFHGRPLAAGDAVSSAESYASVAEGRMLDEQLRPHYADHELQVIPGPHFGRLPSESRAALYDSAFTVSPDSNRMGYRLEGARLEGAGEELLSFGLVPGAVQLPRSGNPILLMADHQTAGGYPVVAVAVSASMPIAAQLAPGDELRFREVTIEAALELRAYQRAALDSLIS